MRGPSAGLRVCRLEPCHPDTWHLEDALLPQTARGEVPWRVRGPEGVVTTPQGCLILHMCTIYVVGWERTISLVLVFNDSRTMAIILLFWWGW